jgi:hypothetical protein
MGEDITTSYLMFMKLYLLSGIYVVFFHFAFTTESFKHMPASFTMPACTQQQKNG